MAKPMREYKGEPLFTDALRLEPGVYAVELTEDFSRGAIAQIEAQLRAFGTPLGITFLVVTRGMQITRGAGGGM